MNMKYDRIIFKIKNVRTEKIRISILISGIFFVILAKAARNFESEAEQIYILLSGLCITSALISAPDKKAILKCFVEWLILNVMLFTFVLSMDVNLGFCIDSNSEPMYKVIIAVIGIFVSIYYIVVQATNIIIIIKKVLEKVKRLIFSSNDEGKNPYRVFLENVAAILVSISAIITVISGAIKITYEMLERIHPTI